MKALKVLGFTVLLSLLAACSTGIDAYKSAEPKLKLEEFFKWYSNFTNTDPITRVEINTIDAACDNGCRHTPGLKFSIFDSNLLSLAEVKPILDDLGKKHSLEIEIVTSS